MKNGCKKILYYRCEAHIIDATPCDYRIDEERIAQAGWKFICCKWMKKKDDWDPNTLCTNQEAIAASQKPDNVDELRAKLAAAEKRIEELEKINNREKSQKEI